VAAGDDAGLRAVAFEQVERALPTLLART